MFPIITNRLGPKLVCCSTKCEPAAAVHLSAILQSKSAGRIGPSVKHDKPVTYEESLKPDMIGVRKSWCSFNTSGVVDGIRKAETAHEDLFIRKFIHGTFPRILSSNVIIKRRANQITISFMAIRMIPPIKFYFLVGYTEEILSYVLKSVVKLELQTIADRSELVYKYI